MRATFKHRLGITLVIVLFILIGYYAFARSAAVRQGVTLTVASITDGETVTDGTLHVAGTAKNATRLSLNDGPILIDQEGAFNEQLLLLPGYNIITLKAEDRFGKKAQKIFRVLYTPLTTDIPIQEQAPAEPVTPSSNNPSAETTPSQTDGTGSIIINN